MMEIDEEISFEQRKQRLLVRHFMDVNFVSEEELKEVYDNMTFVDEGEHEEQQQTLHAFITNLNKELFPICMEIRQIQSPSDGTIYWGLVNIKNNKRSIQFQMNLP